MRILPYAHDRARLKRLFKRIAIGFGLLIGFLLVINGILGWKAQRRLDQKIAELRAAGEPAALGEIAPKPIAPEENAAVYLHKMAIEAHRFNQEWDKAFYKTPLGEQLSPVEENDLIPDEKLVAAIRPIVDGHASILATLDKAASCDQYASLLDYSLPPRQFLEKELLKSAAEPRDVARFVYWKMVLDVTEGKSDEAVNLALQMLRLTRFYDQEPSLINHLVSLSMRSNIYSAVNMTLRVNQLSASSRAKLDAELALQDSLQPLQSALRSERAFAIPYGTEEISGIAAFVRWPALNWLLGELDAEDEAYRVAKLPLIQIHLQWDPVTKRFKLPELDAVRSRAIWSAVEASFIADFRVLAQCRCLRVINALGEYRDRTGKEAESIEQLSLPREAIIDPCTVKPLRIRKTEAGWIVYSLYRNGEDDGGQYHPEDGAWGFGPPGYESSAAK